MQNIHLASEEDLYSGYNDYNPSLDPENLDDDASFQQAVKTSHGRRPPMTGRAPGTAARGRLATTMRGRAGMPSSMGRPTTGAVGADGGVARPMTAVRAAGYTSGGNRGASFDPLNQRGPAPPLEVKNEDTPEEKIKQLEKKVNELIEESCFAANRGELNLALEKAKEAGRKERILVRQREQMAANDQINLDLTYSVLFNLANMYEANEMFSEALNTYQVIVKNKMFSNAGRLKVNMGNIYFKQRNYPKAVKFYRMALDQVPNTHKDMRIKIMQNIGVVFVKMGQYSDAITSFEHIMGEKPDFRTSFNLILCYFAIGDRDKMKRSFQRLLQVDLHIDDEDKYLPHPDDQHANMVLEAIKNDTLRQEEKKIKSDMERYVMASAKIIAPAIEQTFAAGYDWCVDCVKSSLYTDLANDLEINKAVMYLKQKDTTQAIETLKGFEKKDSKCASAASTNLSFLYFLQNDYQLADKYAEMAIQADRYNPYAMVNKGNCLFAQGDYEKAREYYQEAGRTDSSCTEALYNLGLTNKKINLLEDALDCFLKLHAILRNSPQVLYHLATLYEMLEDSAQASEWYMQLIGVVTTDPGILARLGEIYDNEGDKSQAFQYHYESYRYFPSNIEIIEWLGAYYIDSQFCEKAIHYFERAAVIQPTQSKWQLMIASCHRRSGNYQQALETYKHIHKKFPENIECLKFLVRLCTDMGLTKDAQDYATKLKKAEKAKEVREQRANSATRRSGSGRGTRSGSAGSDSGRAGSGGSSAGSRSGTRGNRSSSGRLRGLPDTSEPYEQEQEVDASYVDPLGPSMERPKTAARSRDKAEDDFADEELGEDLLPE
ncbi:intraflagellar transport protein 88 homolog [Saccoglossus kowalevskii]|uniref:Intraflagellar transport protein 88 homolog n=1 Tax=Saccoglossus kowalevskii TaxID=10224 RepID=A0ABM0MRM6_SACKO|nr:PREDICTED: intraflagellar transport protein 88 homolog [Saccoglossus kowalevskii]